MDYEEVLHAVGSFGRYQKVVLAMVSLSLLPNPFLDLMFAFTQYESEFHCELPTWMNVSKNSDDYEKLLNLSIPWEVDSYGIMRRNRCKMYKIQNTSDDHRTINSFNQSDMIRCRYGYHFNDFNSVTAKFSMVCADSWKAALAITFYMMGMGIAIFSGYISDRFGRRPVFLATKFGHFIFAGLLSMSWNYTSYLVLSLLIGLCSSNYSAAFVLATEMIKTKRNLQVALAISVMYAVGVISSPLLGYLLPNWRWFLRASFYIGVLYLPLIWYFPESLRWCMVSKRRKQSIALMKKIAETNGKMINAELIYDRFQSYQINKEQRSARESEMSITREDRSYFLQWVNPTMRMRYIGVCTSWIAACMMSYAISFYPTNLSGDRIINKLLISLTDVPVIVISYYLPLTLGRVRSAAILYLLSGTSYVISPFFKKVSAVLVTSLILVAKTTIQSAFCVIYLITNEISPTLVRSTSLGVASISARVGCIIMPFLMLAGKGENEYTPYVTMGTCALVAAIMCLFFIPETENREMPDSLEMALKNRRIYGLNLRKKFESTDKGTKIHVAGASEKYNQSCA